MLPACAPAPHYRSFPFLTASRTPDWGWRMTNEWVVFEMDAKQANPGKGREGVVGVELTIAGARVRR